VEERTTARIRLDIAYDGTDFFGWGKQPVLRTVQGELEAGLATIFRRFASTPTLVVAGRTDAGVHATGQVAHLDLGPHELSSLDKGRDHGGPESLARRLNGIAGLSSDVVVTRSSLAPADFDARFSAIWRQYEYRVEDATVPRNPLLRNQVVSFPAVLDVAAMNAAAKTLLGLHDWASFCKPREGATTIRTLEEFEWVRTADGILAARVRADAFCHNMVRALVGASIAVGQGVLDPADLVRLREARARTAAIKVAPAKGLTLVAIGYPPDDELAARAEQTRARRSTLP
jgi:tRNA pseudouridine38-40 synthase